MTRPLSPRRLWRYEVTAVDGFPDGAPVAIGDVIIDRWQPDRCWQVFNFSASPTYVGSWAAKLLGEVQPDEPAYAAAAARVNAFA